LPSTFAGVRQAQGGKWSDTPFASITAGGATKVALPTVEPKDRTIWPVFGSLISLLESSNIEITPCTGAQTGFEWTAFAAIKDSILGACLCLGRDEITPVETVPPNIRAGWDFALWYCQAAASKVMDSNEFFKVARVTSLSKTKSGVSQWQAGGQFGELTRLDTIIRLCAHRQAHKLKEPKKFLKAMGYFLDRAVGKKPIKGLFTDEEFLYASQQWSIREDRVKQAYQRLPDNWSDIAGQPGGIKPYLDNILRTGQDPSKAIRDAVAQRIKSLTYIPTKGRDRTPKIVPGSSLRDKILNTHLPGLRTIAYLMHSPLNKVSRATFSDVVLNIAWDSIRRSNPVASSYEAILQDAHLPQDTVHDARTHKGSYIEAASLYVETFSTYKDEEPWAAFFGRPLKA